MALTKVTGHVIKSDTNIISHNINSSGIITAITFDGNVSGVAVTFTGDSTIGSLGITTNLTVGGISTFTGNIDANGDIDVDGHTNLDNVSVSGVSTFAGNADFSAGIDVTGHATVSQSLTVSGGYVYAEGGVHIENSDPRINLVDTNGNPDYHIRNSGGALVIRNTTNGINNLVINSGGEAVFGGNAVIPGNLSVGGVLTYQDVTNIDSIGIVTARSDIRGGRNLSVTGISTFSKNINLPDSSDATDGRIRFGATQDMMLFHYGGANYIDVTTNLNIRGSSSGNTISIKPKSAEEGIKIIPDGAVELYHNNIKKAETSTQGILTPNNLGISFGDGGCKVSGQAGGGASVGLFFMTNSSTKWQITGDGHLLPDTAGAVDIGSASKEIGHIFMADSKTAHFGSDQDLRISFDGGNAVIRDHTGTGSMRIANNNQWIQIEPTFGQFAAIFKTAEQIFFHSNQVRLTTTSTGITVGGEVAASQDYPNFRPTTDFNFAKTKRLDPNIRYYRTGTASYTDEDGFIRVVGEGEPRFDHDPATKESLGLLIEESRTNMVNHSENLGYSSWQMNNAATRFKATTEAPDGKTSDGGAMVDGQVQAGVWEIVETSSNSTHLIYQQLSGGNVSTSTNYHISAFAKPGLNRTHFCLTEGNTLSATAIFDVANGTVTHTFGTGSPQAKISGPYGDGWYRCVLRYTTTASQSYINIQLGVAQNGTTNSYAGDGSSSIAVWGVQIERGGTSETSYIQNWGRNNTRGREYIEVQNPNERFPLTIVSETSTKEFNYARRPLAMSPLGATDTIRPFLNDSGDLVFFTTYNSSSGYASHPQSETGLVVNVPFKYAYAISSTSVSSPDKSCVNGGTVKSSGNTTLSETKLTQYRIGYSTAGDAEREWMGHVRRFMIYDTFLSDGNLKTITS